MQFLILVPICLILSVCLVTVQAIKISNYKVIAVLIKAAASLLFVVFGALSLTKCQDRRTGIIILIGLILGALGDVLLELQGFSHKNQLVFYAGGFSFFFGHIVYLAALIPLLEHWWPSALAGVTLGLVIALVMYTVFTGTDTSFRILSCFYILAVTMLAAFGTGMFLQGKTLRDLMLMLGGIFFLGSDTILIARINGGNNGWQGGLVLILLYYGAQLLIGGCLQFS